jgi:hypothetical protein
LKQSGILPRVGILAAFGIAKKERIVILLKTTIIKENNDAFESGTHA